ncbi:efflux transporter outer membrane subunit [Geovibrio thiophilus]|nr:efflux transporter outer membrane subunit [Geovibrio thiophilus]
MKYTVIFLFAVSAVLSACGAREQSLKVKELNTGAPESFVNVSSGYVPDFSSEWWNVFDDTALDGLIREMFAKNYELEDTYVSLEIKRAGVKSARADRLPTLTAGVGVSDTSREADGGRRWQDEYELSARASWEADIWGRNSSLVSAAEYDAAYAGMTLRGQYLSLSAELADRYFLYRYETERLGKLTALEKLYEKLVTADRNAFKSGLGSLEDIYESEKKLETVRISRASSESTLMSLREEIALMLAIKGAELPELPQGWHVRIPDVPYAIPAEVIAARADIKAAQYAIYRTDRQLAAAIADRYPSLSLSAAGVYGSDSVSSLIRPEAFAFSLVADALFTVFDGGKKRTAVTVKELELDSYILKYRQAVLAALHDIEKGLLENAYREKSLEELKRTAEKNRSLYELGSLKFKGGLIPIRSVIAAETSMLEQEISLLGAERELVSARISLIRALGSGWEEKYIADKSGDGK